MSEKEEYLQVKGIVTKDGKRQAHIVIENDGMFNYSDVHMDRDELERYIDELNSTLNHSDFGVERQSLVNFVMTLEDTLEEMTFASPDK